MSDRFTAFGWSISLAPGWTAEIREETACGETTRYVFVTPASKDASLRLTPDDRGLVEAEKWVAAVGRINRAKGRRVSPAQCGDFIGIVVDFVSDDEGLRGWALCRNAVPLDACYRCKVSDIGRDDRVVDEMLSNLRLEKMSH